MKVKIGVLLMSLGVLLMLAAGGWNLYQNAEEHRANREALEALPGVQAAIEGENNFSSPVPAEASPPSATLTPSPSATPVPSTAEGPTSFPVPQPTMKVVYSNQKPYVGTLQIPALGLTLPIQAQWSYAKLKHTPCHYSGSPESGNLVLIAHNYGGHFGRLNELSPGAEISFIDAAGNLYLYEVDVMETLQPNQNGYLTAGDWPLSLATCTPGGLSRNILRCNLKSIP